MLIYHLIIKKSLQVHLKICYAVRLYRVIFFLSDCNGIYALTLEICANHFYNNSYVSNNSIFNLQSNGILLSTRPFL